MGNIIVISALIVVVIIAVISTIKRIIYGSSCCGKRDGLPKKVRVNDKNKEHYPFVYTLLVDGMHCSACARRVENAFNSLDGVWAKVNLEKKTVLVRTKREIGKAALCKVVENTGYSVKDLIKN